MSAKSPALLYTTRLATRPPCVEGLTLATRQTAATSRNSKVATRTEVVAKAYRLSSCTREKSHNFTAQYSPC